MILFIRGSQKRQQTSERNKKKQTHRYRDKLVVTVGKGKWGGANRGRGVRGTNYYVNSKYFIIIINRVSHLNHYIVNHYIRHILYINYTSINFFKHKTTQKWREEASWPGTSGPKQPHRGALPPIFQTWGKTVSNPDTHTDSDKRKKNAPTKKACSL